MVVQDRSLNSDDGEHQCEAEANSLGCHTCSCLQADPLVKLYHKESYVDDVSSVRQPAH